VLAVHGSAVQRSTVQRFAALDTSSLLGQRCFELSAGQLALITGGSEADRPTASFPASTVAHGGQLGGGSTIIATSLQAAVIERMFKAGVTLI